MEEKIICKNCDLDMVEICDTGVKTQIGEMKPIGTDEKGALLVWVQTGMRSQKLYQCVICKTIQAN